MLFARRDDDRLGIEESLNFFEMMFRHILISDDDGIL